jgi:hypothetical protein
MFLASKFILTWYYWLYYNSYFGLLQDIYVLVLTVKCNEAELIEDNLEKLSDFKWVVTGFAIT